MIESGSRELAERVASTRNFGYVPDIRVPGVAEWIADSGLDAEECAWIQPSYYFSCPPFGQSYPYCERVDGDPVGTTYCSPSVPNSSGYGARIGAFGSVEASRNNVLLTAVLLPRDQFGFFLASQTQDLVPMAGGSQGTLCLGGNIARYSRRIKNSGPWGSIFIRVDLTSIPTSPPHSVMAGETWNFQAWFRDSAAQSSNFTDALSVTFRRERRSSAGTLS